MLVTYANTTGRGARFAEPQLAKKLEGEHSARFRRPGLDNPVPTNNDPFTPPHVGGKDPTTGAPRDMSDYTYVTPEEVQRVCRDIGIKDWTGMKDAEVDGGEAEIIRNIVAGEALDIPLDDFKLGLQIELEHGLRYADANVSNNHPILTGRIVLAHLKEGLDYYLRLKCMELEMEIADALATRDVEKGVKKRRELAKAREKLEAHVLKHMR